MTTPPGIRDVSTRLRWKVARWLVGPFVTFPRTGTWLVVRDAEHDTTFAIPVKEWTGTVESGPLNLDPHTAPEPRLGGSFSGVFGVSET